MGTAVETSQTSSPSFELADRPLHGSNLGHPPLADMQEALSRYFDIMYQCDSSRLDEVFAESAQLHGYRNGEMIVWSIPTYRKVLAGRASPMSLNARREDEILLIDFVSDEMALAKVRLRINDRTFVDYLIWHRIGPRWLITAKGFHLAD